MLKLYNFKIMLLLYHKWAVTNINKGKFVCFYSCIIFYIIKGH
jgi:hypothetical protein